MTDAPSAKAEPPAPGLQAKDMAAAALVLGAAAAESAAEAAERNGSGSDPLPAPSRPAARPRGRRAYVPRRREPLRRSPATAGTAPVAVSNQPPTLGGAPETGAGDQTDTRSELRDWIKDNATLLSNASLLISLSAVALSLLPEVGVFSPYIKALLFAGSLLLLTELHHQWPDDLQLHRVRTQVGATNHSWRMIGFALVMQVATLVFAVWATLTNPIILLPLTALAVFVAFYRWYFRRHSGLLARGIGIVALVVVLLLSELLMVVVWAAVTGDEVTIELWTDDLPELNGDR